MSSLEVAKQAWANDYAGLPQAAIDERVRAFGTIVRGIAKDGSISVERFAKAMALDATTAKEVFAGLAGAGMQMDEKGDVVGAALTARETVHKVRVAGKNLYAWCALDTLFIPGILDATADVESTCPTSGETIRLTVSTERIETCEPSSTWLSVFLPGRSSLEIGPASPT